MSAAERRQSACERIVRTAFRLFDAHGARGVGVDTVVAESGVAKATLYKHFPHKEDLVLAYLDQACQNWSGALRAAAKAAGEDPADQLVGMFDMLSVALQAGQNSLGFLRTAAESAPGTRIHQRCLEHRNALLAWVRETARRTGASDPDLLARQLFLLLDGALARGVLEADAAVADVAKDAACLLVTAARGGETGRPPDVTASATSGVA